MTAVREGLQSGAMGLLKEHAPFGKSIDIGCLGLRVSSKTTDPIVQIIDGNEQNVGALPGLQEKTCEA